MPRSNRDVAAPLRVHVYTICWNEALMLPYFLRHYERIAERIVVFDNGSDDASPDIVRAHQTAELKSFDSSGESREDIEIDIKNNVWKQSRDVADFVIVCDVDELLFHPQLTKYLEDCRRRKITVPIPTGYQMVAARFPVTDGQIYDEVPSGLFDPRWSKHVLFAPEEIEEINYGPGCHEVNPVGRCWCEQEPQLKLLHYKFLGAEYLIDRYRELGARKSAHDRSHNYGHQYFLSEAYLKAKLDNYRNRSARVVTDSDASWWRLPVSTATASRSKETS